MLMSLFLFLLQACLVLQLTASYSPPSYAKPGCQDHCGDVLIPYPFGITPNCYYNKFYEIICNTSFRTFKPFLHKFNLEVMDIQWQGSDPSSDDYVNRNVLVRTAVHSTCRSNASIDFSGSPFAFSSTSNVLVMEGCSGSIVLRNRSGNILGGCATVCGKHSAVEKDLYGVGSCQALLTNSEGSFEFYELDLDVEADSSTCNDTRIGLMDSLSGLSVNELSKTTVPTTLRWAAPASYVQANSKVNHHSFYCEIDSFDKGCSCSEFYGGNPYLPYGCQLVKECRKCRYGCDTTGYTYYCKKNPLFKWESVLGFSLGMGLMVLLLGSYGLYRLVKKRRQIQNRSDYFKRNGGLLLQQQLRSIEGAQSTKVFQVLELEKATDNFNKNRILGQGGQGTVYKGMLKDGRIVAIKKSRKVDENQLEQFINEVVILSEINHRNVVRLLGCCLETEVPLLVYEFIQNGTLYQHIHDASGDFHVTWKMRLQMAAESADAIAYLHSSSSSPIYHRDIKSANILLDDKFRAKVSDFGASRAIDIEQTHLTTCVIGTYGYLDPEYFQSNVFTEKSDVYSFGVVLVELITGKKPICPTKDGGWINLAVEFLFQMENSRLFDMLDPRVLDEGKKEEFVAVAELARQCLNMNGKERPTMKEIAILLDEIRSSHVPYSTEPNSVVGKGVMMEMSDNHIGSSSASSFFSGVRTGASSTVVQRVMAQTI